MDTKQERLDLLSRAYTVKKVDDEREQITVINDELPEEARNAIRDLQFKLNDETGSFELDYEIMSDACSLLSDIELADLEEADLYEHESASVYTSTRLGYLNSNNQGEIGDLMQEMGLSDIADGAAYWYDRQVTTAAEMLREWVLEGEDADDAE